jgi:hypothetical protein
MILVTQEIFRSIQIIKNNECIQYIYSSIYFIKQVYWGEVTINTNKHALKQTLKQHYKLI